MPTSGLPRQATFSSQAFPEAETRFKGNSAPPQSGPDQGEVAVQRTDEDVERHRVPDHVITKKHDHWERDNLRRKRTKDLLRGRDWIIGYDGIDENGQLVFRSVTKESKRNREATRDFYLPQHPLEEDARYSNRLKRTPIQRYVDRALDNLVNKIHREPVTWPDEKKLPEKIQKWIRRVDREGNGINDFSKKLTYAAAAEGVQLALVDQPKLDSRNRTELDDRRDPRMPFVDLITPDRLLNWDQISDNSGIHPGGIRVECSRTEKDGLFGEKQVEAVKVYRRFNEDRGHLPDELRAQTLAGSGGDSQVAYWEEWVKDTSEDGDGYYVLTDAGNLAPHLEIPIVELKPTAKAIEGTSMFRGVPLFDELAEIAISVAQTASDEWDLHYWMSKVIIFLSGVDLEEDGEEAAQFKGGDIDRHGRRVKMGSADNSSFFWAQQEKASLKFVEHTGQVAASLRQLREDYKDEGNRLMLEPFLERSRETVVGASFEQDRVKSKAEQYATDLVEALHKIVKLAAMYLGEDENEADEIPEPKLNVKVGIDTSLETRWASIENDVDRRLISKQTAVTEKSAMGLYRNAIDFEEEQKKIDAEIEHDRKVREIEPEGSASAPAGLGAFGAQGGKKAAQSNSSEPKSAKSQLPRQSAASGTAKTP